MPVPELNLKINLSYGNEYLQDENYNDKQLMFIFWGIITPVISVIGVIGNILTIVVLFRREMKSITVYFLRMLVITDSAILCGVILGLSSISITQMNPNLWLYTDVIYPHIFMPTNYLVLTLQMINVWTTVAVSVERYIAICHPFKLGRICKKTNAFILMGIITFISIVYNIPRCFATTHTSCERDNANKCFSVISTDFGKSTLYEKIYSLWLYMVTVYIVPLLLLLVLNTLLIMELMRMRRRRNVPDAQENSEANMGVVLVLIVVVFIVCQTPGLVAQLWVLESSVLLKMICVSNTMVVLNSSVNFLIYTAVGRKFRKVLLKTFQICIKGPVKELKTSYTQINVSQNGQPGTANGRPELTNDLPEKTNGPCEEHTDEQTNETCTLKGCSTQLRQ